MNRNEFQVVKREMEQVGRQARQVMHPLEVAGVLVSMYPEARLPVERQTLAYALLVLLERPVRSGSQGGVL